MRVVSWREAADNKLEITPQNTNDLSYPIDATIVVTVRNRAGVALTGLTNVAAPYVSGTGANAIYRMPAPASVVPPVGLYEAQATATRAGITGQEFVTITVEKG